MPLIKENLVTTLRTKNKTIRVDEILTRSEILALQTDAEAVHNSTYKPDVVDAIKTTNQTNLNVLGTTGDFVLLISQTTTAENGLYEQTGASTTVKQATPSIDTLYVEQTNGLRAVFNTVINEHMRVYYNRFSFNETLTTTSVSTTNVFEIPVIENSSTIIQIEVLGYLTSDYTDSFNGSYKRTFYNENGTLRDGGVLVSEIKRTKSGFTNLPVISFDTSGDEAILQFSPGTGHVTETRWFIKGNISF